MLFRSLILRLRDRGATVFFSSHVLSDAEALCSQVAIVVGGRLVSSGHLTDLLALRVRGWELVMAGLSREAIDRIPGVQRLTQVGVDRYVLELPLTPPPEQLLASCVAHGASLVSLNPIRPLRSQDVLQEIFYEHPIFDMAAIQAQTQVPHLQGQQHTWFAGAWMGYGFHEDGVRSGMRVAEALGVSCQ